jgi:hypothetical protein
MKGTRDILDKTCKPYIDSILDPSSRRTVQINKEDKKHLDDFISRIDPRNVKFMNPKAEHLKNLNKISSKEEL